jgi:NADPH:quinone reductase-like Zn-dependent oxidoreductase
MTEGTMETMAPAMSMMDNGGTKFITQSTLGGPEVLTLQHRPKPEPGISEILIRVHTAAVNPIDGVNRETGAFIGEPPFVLGWDISGTVEAVGLGVTLYQPGDEVFGMLPFPAIHGSYAEYAVGPTRAFVRKPASISHVDAGAIPMVGLTAYQALVDTANVSKGQRVLINGAAGGIGHVGVQIAKSRGAYVIGLASSANLDFVRSLGADEAIDYNATDFTAVAGDLDAVLDVVGGDYPDRALTVLKRGGVIVTTQPTTLQPKTFEEAAKRGIRVAGILVEDDRLGMQALADLMETGKLKPTVTATYSLEEAGLAESSKPQRGKVVLTVM